MAKITLPNVRFSYAHVWEPSAAQGSDEMKYSVSILIPKSDKKNKAAYDKALEAAQDEYKTKFGKLPAKLKTPLRDGDDERPDDEAYTGHWFFSASGKRQPGIVDRTGQPIIDADEFYSGCYGHVSLNLYPYSNQSKGIAAGLNNIMKTKDGENLGGGVTSAKDDFAEFIEEDEFGADDLPY